MNQFRSGRLPKLDEIMNYLALERSMLNSDLIEGITEFCVMDIDSEAIMISRHQPDIDKLQQTDLSSFDEENDPIIVRKLRDTFILLDGIHLLARKRQAKIFKVNCWVLS